MKVLRKTLSPVHNSFSLYEYIRSTRSRLLRPFLFGCDTSCLPVRTYFDSIWVNVRRYFCTPPLYFKGHFSSSSIVSRAFAFISFYNFKYFFTSLVCVACGLVFFLLFLWQWKEYVVSGECLFVGEYQLGINKGNFYAMKMRILYDGWTIF